LSLGNRVGRVEQQADRARRWHKLMDQLQPFLPGIYVQRDHPRQVAARPIQAGDKSGFDRVDAAMEDDWNCPGRRLCSHRRGISTDGSNHGHLTANEIGGQGR
jgi:hypothetical protein